MSQYSDFFRNSCFPDGPDINSNINTSNSVQNVFNKITDTINKRTKTQPRVTAFNTRHPDNQGGMIVNEDGTVEVRSGHELYDHAIGASVSLMKTGQVLITAPTGVSLSGNGIYFSNLPSKSFTFLNGRFTLNNNLEESALIVSPTTTLPNSALLNKLLILLDTGNGNVVEVKLTDFFNFIPLYKQVEEKDA